MRWLRGPATIAALLLAVGALLVLHSCGGEPTGPRAGTLFVELATPNADDGAVRVRVAGPGISDPAPASGYQLYHRLLPTGALEAVVVGNIATGRLLSFRVPDVRERYAASILEVATGSNALREPPTGYTAQVRR